MSVKLRLKRNGRANRAFSGSMPIDSRSPRDGRVIEELGYYDPLGNDPAKQFFVAKLDRCRYWLDTGAIPSHTVSSLLKKRRRGTQALRLPHPGKPKRRQSEGQDKAAASQREAAAEKPAQKPAEKPEVRAKKSRRSRRQREPRGAAEPKRAPFCPQFYWNCCPGVDEVILT